MFISIRKGLRGIKVVLDSTSASLARGWIVPIFRMRDLSRMLLMENWWAVQELNL